MHRLRHLLSMHADEVYSLESRKAQLKLGLDERRHEIEVHRDGLRAELKLVREDIHRWAQIRPHREALDPQDSARHSKAARKYETSWTALIPVYNIYAGEIDNCLYVHVTSSCHTNDWVVHGCIM